MSRMIQVAIGDLYPSRSNVRPYDAATDKHLAPLVASIRSVGLIQPIGVSPRKKGGGFEVVAGQRRLAALKIIAAETPDFPPVDCVEITDKKALTEVSLAENYVRAAMSLPEIYTAFARIRAERPTATLEELGAMFGFDAHRTGRIMRLAGLSHRVMEQYRGGDIDDAEAQAFAATENHELQDSVLAQIDGLPKYQRGPQAIRRLLGLASGEQKKRMRFIGLDAYLEAGGQYEADLFNEGEGIIRSPDILEQLVGAKMDEAKDDFIHRIQRGNRRIVADGAWGMADLKFSWASEPPKKTEYGHTSDDYELRIRDPKLSKLTDEQQEEADRLDRLIEQLSGELEVEGVDDNDPRFADLEQYEKDRDAIEDTRFLNLPRKGAVVGIAELDHDGSFDVALWFASRAEKGVAEPTSGKTKGAVGAEPSPGEAMRRRVGITKDGAHAMFLMRRDMIRDQLCISAIKGSSIALDFLIYSQARTILNPTGRSYDGSGYLEGRHVGIETPASQDTGGSKPPKKVRDLFSTLTVGSAYRALFLELAEREWVTVDDPIVGWPLIRESGDHDAAHAIVSCFGLMASTSFYSDGETPRMIEELAKYLTPAEGATSWRDTVVLDAAFFGLINHKRRVELLTAWGADPVKLSKAKSGETAAMCAEAVPADWLPEPLMLQDVQPLGDIKAALRDKAAAIGASGDDEGDDD